MGIWDAEVRLEDDLTVPWGMAVVGALIFIVAFAIIGEMDYQEEAGCNLPDDQRTEQQNEECGL